MGLLESKHVKERDEDTLKEECKEKIIDTRFADKEKSEKNLFVYCDLCYPQSDLVDAVRFCQMCHRYLCKICYDIHKHSPGVSVENSTVDICSPECLSEINPRGKHEGLKPWITGMSFMSSRELLVADGNNLSVKIIRVHDSEIVSKIVLTSEPFDVAVVSKYEAGVTLPEQQRIQFLGTLNGLSKTRHMNVDGHCFGIAHQNGLTAIAFLCPEKVEILTSEGKILKRIITDLNGKEIFSAPYYIAFCHTGKYMYVSDHRKDSVIKISTTGHVIATYRAGDLDRPEGLTVKEDGNVIVASRDSNCLHVISSTCTKLKVLSGEKSMIERPWAVSCSPEDKHMYVSNDDGENIDVYAGN